MTINIHRPPIQNSSQNNKLTDKTITKIKRNNNINQRKQIKIYVRERERQTDRKTETERARNELISRHNRTS